MSRAIDFILPINVYYVGGAGFSKKQVRDMIARTNRKLYSNNTGILIELQDEIIIPNKSMAYVDDVDAKRSKQLEKLLLNGSGANKFLRLFLVKTHVPERHGSWTYDPVSDCNIVDVWGGAIFITELFNDNNDKRYVDLGLLQSNDTLLHELGHVLMQEGTHYTGTAKNFFHEKAELTDDTILPFQVSRMRGEAPIPNYLVKK